MSRQRPAAGVKKPSLAIFDPSVSKQLKQLALDEDSTVQQLLGEALDLLFQARGQPPNREREHLLWKLRRGPEGAGEQTRKIRAERPWSRTGAWGNFVIYDTRIEGRTVGQA